MLHTILHIYIDALLVAIANGSPVQLVGTFVDSPLVWSVLGEASLETLGVSEPKKNIRVGVSRLGSGSHTMAHYLAHLHNWDPTGLSFVVANNFDGLRKGLVNGDFDLFLWEHFTTKKYVDSGEIRKVGDVETPWTAFSIASRQLMSVEYTNRDGSKSQDTILSEAIQERLYPALREGISIFKANRSGEGKGSEGIGEMIACIVRDFGHNETDAKLWHSRVRYSDDMRINRAKTTESMKILKSIGLVPAEFDMSVLFPEP